MGEPADIAASVRLRVLFAVAAAIMLALWGWSLVPPIENWGNPNDDGLSYVGVFYTTLICLPAGLFLLIGAIAGHGRHVRRAHVAFFVAAGITVIVLAFQVIAHIANNNQGKVFGIQIGFRLDYQCDAVKLCESNVSDGGFLVARRFSDRREIFLFAGFVLLIRDLGPTRIRVRKSV